MASGADLRVAYVPESSFGQTPTTPAFDLLRVTSGGLSTTKGTVTSDEIRADQNVVDELQVSQDVDGSYAFELSYGSFDDILEAALCGTWTSNVLKNGVVERFFSFEETIENGATDLYRLFSGCMVDTLSLSIAAREKITGSIGIVGKREAVSGAAQTGAVYGSASAEEIMVAGTSVGSITIGSLTNTCVQSMSVEIARNLRRINCVGSIHSNEMVYGRCDVTGTVQLYFRDQAHYDTFLNDDAVSIEAVLGHDANKKYRLTLPRVRWTGGGIRVGGQDDDIMVDLPFRATLSGDHSIQIERAVA